MSDEFLGFSTFCHNCWNKAYTVRREVDGEFSYSPSEFSTERETVRNFLFHPTSVGYTGNRTAFVCACDTRTVPRDRTLTLPSFAVEKSLQTNETSKIQYAVRVPILPVYILHAPSTITQTPIERAIPRETTRNRTKTEFTKRAITEHVLHIDLAGRIKSIKRKLTLSEAEETCIRYNRICPIVEIQLLGSMGNRSTFEIYSAWFVFLVILARTGLERGESTPRRD